LVNYLIENPGKTFYEIDRKICKNFPGLGTPEMGLVEAILSSYAIENENHQFQLKPEEKPTIRREDLQEIRQSLLELGAHLGYQIVDQNPIIWMSKNEEDSHYFYLIASAVIGEIVTNQMHPANQGVIILPGSRAELLMYKQDEAPQLKHAVNQGWNFLKFRQIRQMVKNKTLTRESLKTYFADDPLADVDPQLKMF